jgi:PKD repeat protein
MDYFMQTVEFYNNIIAFNGTRSDHLGGGVGFYEGDFYIYNNVFYHNDMYEVSMSPPWGRRLTSFNFVNNIIVPDPNTAYKYYYSYADYMDYPGVVSNNCYFGGSDGIPTWDTSTLEEDPDMTDPENDDFSLKAGSPCIDGGTSVVSGVLTTDYLGIARPQGVNYDIGTHEYLSGGTPNQVPVISDISATPTSGDAPLSVDFTVTASDPDGSIASYAWDFGDENTSAVQNPTHSYASAGTYTATCTVTDNEGATASDSVEITVTATAEDPVVDDISATPTSGVAPLTVAFAVTASDPDGTIDSYSWDFGDQHTSQEQNPSHVYTLPGTYTATVTVTDNDGNTDSDTVQVTVTSVTPAAPTNLTATGGDTQVSLSWSAGDNPLVAQPYVFDLSVVAYNVYRSATGGTGFVKINSVTITGTTYTDTGLTNGTTYYYVVTALDAGDDESNYSNEVSATPAGPQTPGNPPGKPVRTGGRFNTEAAANIDQVVGSTRHIGIRNKGK